MFALYGEGTAVEIVKFNHVLLIYFSVCPIFYKDQSPGVGRAIYQRPAMVRLQFLSHLTIIPGCTTRILTCYIYITAPRNISDRKSISFKDVDSRLNYESATLPRVKRHGSLANSLTNKAARVRSKLTTSFFKKG